MEDKNKKILIAVIGLAILALVTVNVLEPGQWSFRDSTDYAEQARLAQDELQQYNQFLASIEPNYAASQQFLQKVASEDLVRQEVESTLETNQRVVIPTLADAELKISSRTDPDFVVNYFTKTKSMIENFQRDARLDQQQFFAVNANPNELAKAHDLNNALVSNLKQTEVPSKAVELHKATIIALQEYGQVFAVAKEYATNHDFNPWPTVYNKYAVINNRLAVTNTELEKLNKTYAGLLPEDYQLPKFSLVKTAHAQFSVTVVTDWQKILYEGIRTGLARAFAQFIVQVIDKIVARIEKTFAIASQLYYSNELGRFYSVEYMKKFVSDPLDRDIITKFLPEYFCVSPDKRQLKKIFVAKARQNVGNDLIISPNDPDFLNKLARLGADEKNYPLWWEGYYQSLAAQTKAEADAAAAKEVLSPGLKSGRDIVNNQINKTISAIMGVQESAIAGAMNLGTSNAENIAGELVATIVQNLVNKFIFTPLAEGSTSGPGGIGIIAERDVCLATAQIKPVVPISGTDYNPPVSPNVPPTTSNPTIPRTP
jgi:murein DD-endopeptidase MepM/ murein hydrolase activator NlpD